MKLKTEENFVLTNSTNEKRFTINASAQAFKILSSALYSRKIEAIVRELSCNAYDSHVMAGYPERPFEVHLPTEWEPEFWIEDFGIGLDKDDVESIYTSYFTSTKNDSNDTIGGLGLGSKTPFSYTDSFNLVSRKNGKEYSYTAYINGNGEPSVTLLSESDTDKPNGVRVTVPVSQNDKWEFKNCCKKVYKYFRTLPVFVNDEDVQIKQIDFELLDQTFYTINPNGSKNTIYAIMGNVCYEVTQVSNTFVQRLSNTAARYLQQVSLLVKFDIGELDVAASRETVSFDPQTEDNFLSKIETACERLIADIQSKVDTVANPEAALELVYETLGEWAYGVTLYKGMPLTKLKTIKLSHQLSYMMHEYFEPRYFPSLMWNYNLMTKNRTVLQQVGTNMPVYSTYNVGIDLYTCMFFYRNRKATMQKDRSVTGGYTFGGHSVKSKLYVLEGTEQPTFETCAREFTKQVATGHIGTSRTSSVLAGVFITRRFLPDELKTKLVDFFGDMIVFKNLDDMVVERKEQKRKEYLAKKALYDAQKAAGLTPVKKVKSARIKKNEFKIFKSYHKKEDNSFTHLEQYTTTECQLPEKFILFTVSRNRLKLIQPNGKYVGGFDYDSLNSFCHMSAVDNIIIIKEADTKTKELLMPKCVDPIALYDKKCDELMHSTDMYTFVKSNVTWCVYNYWYNEKCSIEPLFKSLLSRPNVVTLASDILEKHKNAFELYAQLAKTPIVGSAYRAPYELRRHSHSNVKDYVNNLRGGLVSEIDSIFAKDEVLNELHLLERHDLIEKILDKGYKI